MAITATIRNRHCGISRARCRPVLSIKAKRPRIATDNCAASRAARSRPPAFVNFLQNHDQIGNRALGDRLESLAADKAIEAALAITLLAPMIPMLFMGEEWGSTAPFPFFCDFEGDLADAVRNGRRKEFAGAYAKYGDEVPDPLDETTFRSAVLDWNARDLPKAHRRLTLVQELAFDPAAGNRAAVGRRAVRRRFR